MERKAPFFTLNVIKVDKRLATFMHTHHDSNSGNIKSQAHLNFCRWWHHVTEQLDSCKVPSLNCKVDWAVALETEEMGCQAYGVAPDTMNCIQLHQKDTHLNISDHCTARIRSSNAPYGLDIPMSHSIVKLNISIFIVCTDQSGHGRVLP